MPLALVSDTSILIDLERGRILEAAFGLSVRLVVPDLLFRRELASDGEKFIKLGLLVEELDGDGVGMAQEYRRRQPKLSLPDALALALVRVRGWTLLTGDGELRLLATAERVGCHGLLWALDLMHHEKTVLPDVLHRALQSIATHPRCRLPKREVTLALDRYRKAAGR